MGAIQRLLNWFNEQLAIVRERGPSGAVLGLILLILFLLLLLLRFIEDGGIVETDIPGEITSITPGSELSEQDRTQLSSCAILDEPIVCAAVGGYTPQGSCNIENQERFQRRTWAAVNIVTSGGRELTLGTFCGEDGQIAVPVCRNGNLEFDLAGSVTGLREDDCGGQRGLICRNGVQIDILQSTEVTLVSGRRTDLGNGCDETLE